MSACFFTLISLAVAPKEATSTKSFILADYYYYYTGVSQ